MINFSNKLKESIELNNSLLVLSLDPNPEMMPAKYKGNLSQWLFDVINLTRNLICAYKLTLGFYEVLGAEGFILLERILKEIDGKLPVILDAKHGDLNTSTQFARTIFEQWGFDAVTLTPYCGQDHVAPFLVYGTNAVFILTHTSNPGAFNIQNHPSLENPLYLEVVQQSQAWGAPEQVCLEVGTSEIDILSKIRALAPERIILLRSIWKQENNLEEFLNAGLNSEGQGLLIPVPQDFLAQDDIVQQINNLNQRINDSRSSKLSVNSSCELWTADVCIFENHPCQDLILQLYDIGCLIFGEYVQSSGMTFSYYIDLRKIISNPQIFNKVLKYYGDILQDLSFDRIAGIPYGSLPTATGLSLLLQRPMIFPRKEVKAHGTRRLIEGNFHPGEKVVIVDDVLITGKSVIEGAEKLKSAGLVVEDIVVLIDHEEGVIERLQEQGYRAHAVIKLSEITDILFAAGRLDQEQYMILSHS